MIDSGIQETVIQLVPDEYKGMAATLFGVVASLMAMYYFTKPFLDNWRANKQNAVISANALTSENVTEAVNKALAVKEKAEAQKDLITWEYKLLHATTQEAKDMCNLEIAKLKAIVNA